MGLLFGVPPGVGIWLAALRVTGGTEPLFAAAAGVLAGLGLFVIVFLIASLGHAEAVN